jgi:hypothetical protein
MSQRRPYDIPDFVSDALGQGDEALGSDCPEIEHVLASLATVSGELVPTPRLRSRLMSGVSSGPARYAPFYAKLGQLFDTGRDAIVDICERSLQESQWELGPHPSIRLMHVKGGPRVTGADVGLVRMPADFAWPNHRHLGEECVLILEGSYLDQRGTLYRAGDIHEMSTGTEHSFVVQAGQPLVMAVVLFNGIEMV